MNFRTSDYKSFMGALWSFLNPALTFIVTYALFQDRFGKQIPYFTLHLLSGIIVLSAFKVIVEHTIPFLERNRAILINSKTPSEILLFSSMVVPCLKFLIEISLCAGIGLFLGVLKIQNLPLIYLLYLCLIPMAIGFGLILLSLHSYAGDVLEIWHILSQLLYFVSPMFYTLDMLSPWSRAVILYVNPITPFMLSYQSLITGNAPYFSGYTILRAIACSVIIFAIGYRSFKNIEMEQIERI